MIRSRLDQDDGKLNFFALLVAYPKISIEHLIEDSESEFGEVALARLLLREAHSALNMELNSSNDNAIEEW